MSYNLPRGYLSPSAINQYLACPECFRLEYVDKVPKPLSINFPVGGALHASLDRARNLMMKSPIEQADIEDCISFGLKQFDEEVQRSQSDVPADLGKYKNIDDARHAAEFLSDYAIRAITPLDKDRGLIGSEVIICSDESLLNEEEKKLDRIPEDIVQRVFPFPFKGRIDAVYAENGDGIVTAIQDTKTKSKRGAPYDDAVVQMSLYRRPFQQWKPVPGKNHSLFATSSVETIVDVVYKTKYPSLVTYALSHDSDDLIFRMVMGAVEGISRGDFPPRPSWACNYGHGLPIFVVLADWGGVPETSD